MGQQAVKEEDTQIVCQITLTAASITLDSLSSHLQYIPISNQHMRSAKMGLA